MINQDGNEKHKKDVEKNDLSKKIKKVILVICNRCIVNGQ